MHPVCELLYDVGGEFYSIHLFQYGEVDGYNAVFGSVFDNGIQLGEVNIFDGGSE